MAENPPPKYSAPTDGLEEALQMKIAAELYHRVMDLLHSSIGQQDPSYRALRAHLSLWREQIETKYAKLRDLIGLTGGKSNAT